MSFDNQQRVQTHPATDSWMRGDRYGTVIRTKKSGGIVVHLDRSDKMITFKPDNLIAVS